MIDSFNFRPAMYIICGSNTRTVYCRCLDRDREAPWKFIARENQHPRHHDRQPHVAQIFLAALTLTSSNKSMCHIKKKLFLHLAKNFKTRRFQLPKTLPSARRKLYFSFSSSRVGHEFNESYSIILLMRINKPRLLNILLFY